MVEWQQVRSVFLDMDGTLLDLNFDNHFWLEHVPLRYAQKHGLDLEEAKRALYPRFRAIEGTINWYCVDHWTRELGLDIALLKEEVDHLIAVHPHVTEFLDQVRDRGKRVVLVTNAHQKSLDLKMQRTRLGGHFDRVICAHEFGMPKEAPEFWNRVHEVEPYRPQSTLLVDDNLGALRSAQAYGISHLLAVHKPDSQRPAKDVGEFDAIHHFTDIMPVV